MWCLLLLCVLDVSVSWLHMSAEVCSSAPPGLWTCDLLRQRLQPTGPIATPRDLPGLLPAHHFPISPTPTAASLLPLKYTQDLSSSPGGLLLILQISRHSLQSLWQRQPVFGWFLCFLTRVTSNDTEYCMYIKHARSFPGLWVCEHCATLSWENERHTKVLLWSKDLWSNHLTMGIKTDYPATYSDIPVWMIKQSAVAMATGKIAKYCTCVVALCFSRFKAVQLGIQQLPKSIPFFQEKYLQGLVYCGVAHWGLLDTETNMYSQILINTTTQLF